MTNAWRVSGHPYQLCPISLAIGLLMTLRVCATAAPPPAFLVGEPPFAAELAGIDREWNLNFNVAGKVRVVAAGDLAYWGRYRDAESGSKILLAGGGHIRADALRLDYKQLVIGDATGLGRGLWDESHLPKNAVRAIAWQPPAASAERDRFFSDLLRYRQVDDRVLLLGGDEFRGRLLSLPVGGRFAPPESPTGDNVVLAPRSGTSEPLAIPVGKIIASNFRAVESAETRQPSRSAWIGFADGSLVHAQSLSIKGNVVTLGLATGGELQTTLSGRADIGQRFWNAITYVEPVGPRVKWLADVQPLSFKHIPFLSVNRPLGVNESVLGTRLRVGDMVFPRGIGMPSASRAEYDVAGYRKFEAEIAVDAVAGPAGSVVVRVLLEQTSNQWTTAYTSPIVRGGDAPLTVSIDLQNARRMALLIDFADHGDACDYADWLHARLTK
jgi:hypothetical protein